MSSGCLSMSVSLAGAALSMILADESLWVQQHGWLLPLCEYGAIFFAVLSLVSAKWFRRLFIGSLIDQKKADVPKSIEQQTHGPQSPTYAVSSGTMNVYASELKKEAVDRESRQVERILEAVAESPVIVGESGIVIAIISTLGSDGLRPTLDRHGHQSETWETRREACAIPFLVKERNSFESTAVKIRLTSLDLLPSGQTTRIDVDWNQDSQPVRFLVKPLKSGIHKAQVEVLVQGKLKGAVLLETSAEGVVDDEGEWWDVLAKVEVTLISQGPKISKEIKKELGKEQSKGMGYGYGP
jgi:hypothetical protein